MKSILLIEDNTELRENTAETLELANYKVVTASNGKDGVKQAQMHPIDLIICDIMMPELDGYGVLHLLSKNSSTANIPFIFLTAKAEKGDFRKGMNLGADDYLTKPFDDTELLNAVETRLNKTEKIKRHIIDDMQGLNQFLDEASMFHELKDLARDRKVKQYKKKETIYHEDTLASGLYFIISGKVKTVKTNESGKELIIDLYKPGDFLGYNDLLERNKFSESAVALVDSEVCFIPKEDFNTLLFKNKDVATQFIKMLSKDVQEKEDRLLKLAYNSVRKRVGEGLVLLLDKYGKDGKEHFSIAISREDLANIVGTATETVIRTLSDFKEEKLIDIKGSTITVINENKLRVLRN